MKTNKKTEKNKLKENNAWEKVGKENEAEEVGCRLMEGYRELVPYIYIYIYIYTKTQGRRSRKGTNHRILAKKQFGLG